MKRRLRGRAIGVWVVCAAAGLLWARAETEPGAPVDDLPVSPMEDAGERALPETYGLNRYEGIWENSPFMLETPLATIVAESFAKDLAVTSVSIIDGRALVGYVNTKTREMNRATDVEANAQGVRVAVVEPNADPKKVVVELEKNGERAKVSYDSVILQGKPTIPKAVQQPGRGRAVQRPGVGPAVARPVVPSNVVNSAGGRSPVTRRRIVLPKSVTGPARAPVPPPQSPPPQTQLPTN